jgi:hypothetical protein
VRFPATMPMANPATMPAAVNGATRFMTLYDPNFH